MVKFLLHHTFLSWYICYTGLLFCKIFYQWKKYLYKLKRVLIWLRWWNGWWIFYKKHFIIDFSFFLFLFYLFFVWLFFFYNYVIGVSQAVARKVFLEHFSGLAFGLLCYIMYRKCFINFLNGLNDVFKKNSM